MTTKINAGRFTKGSQRARDAGRKGGINGTKFIDGKTGRLREDRDLCNKYGLIITLTGPQGAGKTHRANTIAARYEKNGKKVYRFTEGQTDDQVRARLDGLGVGQLATDVHRTVVIIERQG